MHAFTLERPATLTDATQLAASGRKVLAGGQTLLAAMKLRLAAHEQMVDLGAIRELAGVRREGNAIVIGSMTRHAEVEESDEVRATIPALADLAGQIGDRQVRALGTLGGSIANNDPAACYPAALLGLGATVRTTQREIAADDFFQGAYMTALQDGELVTAVAFPIPTRAAYLKFKHPASRFALVGVFLAQDATGVRVAVTGGGTGVFRHGGLEQALAESFTPQAAASVVIGTDGLAGDIHASADYRANLVSVLAQRAVAAALGQ